MQYFIRPWKDCVKFSGRLGRKEFWIWMLLYLIIGAVLMKLSESVAGIWALVAFLPIVSAEIRRLHDIEKGGKWVLLNFLPIIGTFILWFMMLRKGTDGPNKYGNTTETY